MRSVAYSPDGRHFISACYGNTVRIWDAETGVAVGRPLEGDTASMVSVADAQHIVSGSDLNTIRVWSPSSHELSTSRSPVHAHFVHGPTHRVGSEIQTAAYSIGCP